jgi:UDP-N-acetylglucosamine 2-epimerase
VRVVTVTDGGDDDSAAALIRALEERLEVRPVSLEPGSGSELRRTAAALSALEPALARLRPSAVLVWGDGIGALAAALVASKLDMPLVRIDAGIRSGPRDEPAEINRTVVDRVCDLLLCVDGAGLQTLRGEGLGERARVVGDPAADPAPATDAILAWLETYTSAA